MQNAASLRPYLNTREGSISLIKAGVRNQTKTTTSRIKPSKDILKVSHKKSRRLLGSIEPQPEVFSHSHRVTANSSPEEQTKLNYYLSTIEDPLWKHICQDVLEMMGPVSTLRIWKSKLGHFSPQDKILPITCENEDTALFVQQYDFVILGSVQKYCPALKQLQAKVTVAFTKND